MDIHGYPVDLKRQPCPWLVLWAGQSEAGGFSHGSGFGIYSSKPTMNKGDHFHVKKAFLQPLRVFTCLFLNEGKNFTLSID
jgi:hypothetical protein